MKRIITHPQDRVSIGVLCDMIGAEIIETDSNHTKTSVSLFRKTNIKGRDRIVQVTFSMPFDGVIQ